MKTRYFRKIRYSNKIGNNTSSSNANSENTQIFYGIEKATKAVLDFVSNSDTAIDACIDSTGPSVMMGVDAIKNERLKAKNRGSILDISLK